ncbi:hypothetical protein BH93_02330 [Rhodococcoides fascians A25f]|uniref:hypothetical protein n=1 Tax=Rhodococcoides fascians TaxID=1828 RepID=UPI00055E121F|nr:hypothetical protein [Rhodococcus fascians]QII04352.1 hypothetical protein BH93_02330 [Rhodococcus fascians A25f]
MPNRYGETEEEPPLDDHHPGCRKGWLGEDPDGNPIPCIQCRPHLAEPAKVNDCDPNRYR